MWSSTGRYEIFSCGCFPFDTIKNDDFGKLLVGDTKPMHEHLEFDEASAGDTNVHVGCGWSPCLCWLRCTWWLHSTGAGTPRGVTQPGGSKQLAHRSQQNTHGAV